MPFLFPSFTLALRSLINNQLSVEESRLSYRESNSTYLKSNMLEIT